MIHCHNVQSGREGSCVRVGAVCSKGGGVPIEKAFAYSHPQTARSTNTALVGPTAHFKKLLTAMVGGSYMTKLYHFGGFQATMCSESVRVRQSARGSTPPHATSPDHVFNEEPGQTRMTDVLSVVHRAHLRRC